MIQLQPDFSYTIDTPLPCPHGRAMGVFGEIFKEIWLRYIESTLYKCFNSTKCIWTVICELGAILSLPQCVNNNNVMGIPGKPHFSINHDSWSFGTVNNVATWYRSQKVHVNTGPILWKQCCVTSRPPRPNCISKNTLGHQLPQINSYNAERSH